MLLVRVLDDNEAFTIENAERFCSYRGYGRTWEFAGDYRDDKRARKAVIIGIDASVNRFGREEQFGDKCFYRDVRKCIAGVSRYENCEFATGNWWGCAPSAAS